MKSTFPLLKRYYFEKKVLFFIKKVSVWEKVLFLIKNEQVEKKKVDVFKLIPFTPLTYKEIKAHNMSVVGS